MEVLEGYFKTQGCFGDCNTMKMKIKVHVGSSKEEIRKINDENYEIWLKESAVDNKANLKLIKILKKYFGREVKIKSGFTSRNKIVEVV